MNFIHCVTDTTPSLSSTSHVTIRALHGGISSCVMHVWPKSISIEREQDVSPWQSIYLWCDRLLDRSLMWDPLSYFSFQPVLHTKGHGMCSPVSGMVHIKDPMMLIRKSNTCCGGNWFPLSLSQWCFTISIMSNTVYP